MARACAPRLWTCGRAPERRWPGPWTTRVHVAHRPVLRPHAHSLPPRLKNPQPNNPNTLLRPTTDRPAPRRRSQVAPGSYLQSKRLHLGLSGVRMDRPVRLFLCARCRNQVLLCSHCDRGQRYCGSACSRQARGAAQRGAAQRYQRSRRGRMAHAARTRRWRGRRLAYRGSANSVTHQGSQAGVVAAPLAAWTHDTASSSLDATAAAAPLQDATEPSAAPCCARCSAPLGAWVRQGFLRRGRPRMGSAPPSATCAGRRHDHSP